MNKCGQNEGLRVLDDFVCEAIHDPAVPQAPPSKRGQNEGVRVLADSSSQITHVPLPGSSGQTPTGAIQFQDDWPGLFIRGDEAIFLSVRIRWLASRLEHYDDPAVISAIMHLNKLADIIERDVIVRLDKTAEPSTVADRPRE